MKYFTREEVACKHCGWVPPGGIHPRLAVLLDAIREKAGRPVIVTSGVRCETHNRNVGGVSNSFHCQGVAADIYCDGLSVEELGKIAEECGADGIGLYFGQGFAHVDVRGYPARWTEY